MVRASTEAQKIEDQHREMVQFCINEGYKEEELVFVEEAGASAIKLNDEYMLMIQQVKECINADPEINCFAVWELSRAFRNEMVYVEIKQFLLERHIQFLVKNPNLRLLNVDGTLNAGMEITMALLATLAKQEMELKKERFHRAKKAMREQGKFIGGRTVKYGYRVGKGQYVEEDPETAQVVRLIFSLYSTGKYSIRTLYDELQERGYNIHLSLINKMLADGEYVDGVYPQLISKELFEKCKTVREHNYLSIPKGKKYAFAAGIFKCISCGNNMIAEGDQYRCRHHNKYSAPPHCNNGITIRLDNMDALLWFVASKLEVQYRMRMDQEKETEYRNNITILEQKILTLKAKTDVFEYRKKKIVDTYLEDLISKEERDKRINRLKKENQEYIDTILSYQEQIKTITALLENKETEQIDLEYLGSIYGNVMEYQDLKQMAEIVHKHIKKVTAERCWFGRDRDQRAEKENALLIRIYTVSGKEQKYYYIARKYKKHYFYYYSTDGREQPLLHIKKIIRKKEKSKEPRAFKKISSW